MELLYSGAAQLLSMLNSLMALNKYQRKVELNRGVHDIRDFFNRISIVYVVKMVSFVLHRQKL